MLLNQVLERIGTFLMLISVLAISIERVTDTIKLFLAKYLVNEPEVKGKNKAELKKKEDLRKRVIRVCIAIPVGILLAFIMNIDTFGLIGFETLIFGTKTGTYIMGCIISGLLASRGAAFWHDLIEIFAKIKENKSNSATE